MTKEEIDAVSRQIVNDFMAENDVKLGENRIVYLVAVGTSPGDVQIATNVTLGSLDALLSLIHQSVSTFLLEREYGIPDRMPTAS